MSDKESDMEILVKLKLSADTGGFSSSTKITPDLKDLPGATVAIASEVLKRLSSDLEARINVKAINTSKNFVYQVSVSTPVGTRNLGIFKNYDNALKTMAEYNKDITTKIDEAFVTPRELED